MEGTCQGSSRKETWKKKVIADTYEILVLRSKHNGWFVFLWQVSLFNIAMIMGGPAMIHYGGNT